MIRFSHVLILAQILLLPAVSSAGDAMAFDCKPMYMPQIQGEERFARIEFRADGSAYMGIAEMAGPFTDVSVGRSFRRAYYSHNESSAGASWKGDNDEASVSLAFFGSWWGAVIHFEDMELDMRCSESPL